MCEVAAANPECTPVVTDGSLAWIRAENARAVAIIVWRICEF